jgi:acyl-CoA reductase-like NAD-dependent aldehyde dehydrogenase
MKIVNPATGEPFAELAEDGAAAVADKVRRARAAQPTWAARPLEDKLATITRFRDALVARKDELARTLTREMGKPIAQARNELSAMPGRIDFFLAKTAEVLADDVVLRDAAPGKPALEEVIAHEPLGVVANVSAWNYPYFVGSNVFVPALLTGNAVVYKPSEHAALTGKAIGELLHAAGVPDDVFAVVQGARETGAAVVGADVDGLFFTGSYATGKRIAEATAGRMTKLQLELGGKDPTYVCDDVDAKTAAESLADGAMYNTGQSCCSVERIYVHRKVAPAFSMRSSRPSTVSSSAIPRTTRPTSARSRGESSSPCSRRRSRTRSARARASCAAASASIAPVGTSRRPCSPTSRTRCRSCATRASAPSSASRSSATTTRPCAS